MCTLRTTISHEDSGIHCYGTSHPTADVGAMWHPHWQIKQDMCDNFIFLIFLYIDFSLNCWFPSLFVVLFSIIFFIHKVPELPLVSFTPFTLALLIRSETGFAPMRAFTLHQLIRINDLIRIKLNHLLEVVSHRFSLLRVLIASVDATGTKIKAEQIWRNQCQMLHSYLRCRMPGTFPLQKQCSVVNKILL